MKESYNELNVIIICSIIIENADFDHVSSVLYRKSLQIDKQINYNSSYWQEWELQCVGLSKELISVANLKNIGCGYINRWKAL